MWISIIVSVVTIAVCVVVGFVLPKEKDKYYLYFVQDKINFDLYDELDLSQIQLNSNILDLSGIVYATNGVVKIVDNKLVADHVGSDKLTCSITFKNKVYKDVLDLQVSFDDVDSVLKVSLDVGKYNGEYMMYLPNKNYTQNDVDNVANISINFLDDNFVSSATYYVVSNPSSDDILFNNKHGFDNDIIEINDNIVRAVGVGKAVLKVHFNETNIDYNISIIVNKIKPIDMIVNSGNDIHLNGIGGTFDIVKPQITPAYATVLDYTIEIADSSIVKVENGAFVALKSGLTTATFVCGDITKTVNIIVDKAITSITATTLGSWANNSCVVVEFALKSNQETVPGDIGIAYIVGGEQVPSVDSIVSYEIMYNTIEFEVGVLTDFVIRIYYANDATIFYDIVVQAA